MDKLKLAHDYLLKIMSNSPLVDQVDIEFAVSTAWGYARMMHCENIKEDKIYSEQKRKEIREMLNAPNTFLEREGQHFDDVADIQKPYTSSEEWQPDWSQAPEWANWWAMDGFSEKANWYIDKPYLDDDSEDESEWNIDLRANAKTYIHAPSFNYQGNWQDSLRKRSQ